MNESPKKVSSYLSFLVGKELMRRWREAKARQIRSTSVATSEAGEHFGPSKKNHGDLTVTKPGDAALNSRQGRDNKGGTPHLSIASILCSALQCHFQSFPGSISGPTFRDGKLDVDDVGKRLS